MVLYNVTQKAVLSDRCRFANSVWKRLVGLLNRKTLAPGEGLLFDRCFGIHTIGMRFPIDVLFLDQDLRVLRTVEALPPVRTCAVKRAVYVLELPVGSIRQTHTEAGDQIQLRTADTEPSPVAPAERNARIHG